MQILDILFIVAAAYFIFTGTQRGLIGEIFRLAGLVAGFATAFLYYKELSGVFRFNPPAAAGALAFAIIFLAVLCAAIVAGFLLKKFIHLTPLGRVDSVFGGAVGGAKAVLIFWVICLSFASLPPTKFVRSQHGSFVYRTYKKLPPAVKLSGLMKTRARFKKDTPQKTKGTAGTSTSSSPKKR
ncbi:MAG: CvpA family protein [Chitinispirillaceae bacterium]|nr:CvpA family protein [Chitinispirillaceae bacterium]